MGLDIHIGTDNYNEVYSAEYYTDETNYRSKMRLSRTFCNFMCRRDMVSGIADLDQLGKLANIDIAPIYEMNKYWSDEAIAEQLPLYETENERKNAIEKITIINKKIEGNIDKVIRTVNRLIENLSVIPGLEKKIDTHGYDTLGSEIYYTHFNTEDDQPNGVDNFGRDLRNFKRFLEYAKNKGAKTVYFNYG